MALALVVAAVGAVQAASPGSVEPSSAASGAGLEKATFSMYCYWTGEATLGRVPGVVASRIGHLGGSEVVEVTYDPARTDVGELADALRRRDSFYSLIVSSPQDGERAARYLDAADVDVRRGEGRFIDSKFSLRSRHPDIYYLDLTELQAIALNSWAYFGGPMPDVLTEEQEERRQRLRAKLGSGEPDGLRPDGARSGEALEAYRRSLEDWLAR